MAISTTSFHCICCVLNSHVSDHPSELLRRVTEPVFERVLASFRLVSIIFFLGFYKYFPRQTAPGAAAAAGAAGPRAADAGARGGVRGGAAGAAVLLGDGGALQHRHSHPLHPRHGRARPRHQQWSVLRVCCTVVFQKRSQYLSNVPPYTRQKTMVTCDL